MRRWLPAAAYDQPVTVFMLVLALLVIGGIAWNRIPLQLMPSGFEEARLNVWVSYPNATPIETDEKVVTPLSAQLSTISGIRKIYSSARDEGAYFNLISTKERIQMRRTTQSAISWSGRRLKCLNAPSRTRIWKFNADDADFVYGRDTARRCRGPVLLVRKEDQTAFRAPRRCCDCRHLGCASSEYLY